MFENNKNAILNLVLDLVEKQRMYRQRMRRQQIYSVAGDQYAKKADIVCGYDVENSLDKKDFELNLICSKEKLSDFSKKHETNMHGIDIHNRYIHMLIAQFDELMEYTKQCLESLKVNIEQVYFYTLVLLEMIIGADESLSMVCQNILSFLEDETVCLCDKAAILLGSSVQMFSQDNIINTIITLDAIKEKYTKAFKQSLQHESLHNKLLILDVIGKLCRAILFRDLYAGLRKVQMYV